MKLSRILFKPKWQDKDAATRAAAVAADADPELIAALPELTRTDPDARVRLAALKRLGDYERWRERSTADADVDVRAKARAVYMTLLCSAGRAIPALPRLVSELDTLSPAELETVATTAATRDLRAAALSRVTRPALLIERAMSDPDAALRLAALERVNDPAALKRIAERTRKSDKTISRKARERVESMRIGAGDTGAIAVRARILCERIEALLRDPGADPEGARAAIEKEWTALGGTVPEQLSTRFRGAAAVLQRLLSPAPVAAPVEPVTSAPETITPTAFSEADAAPAVAADDGGAKAVEPRELEAGTAAASRARFDAALAAAAEQSRRERDRERERRETTLRQIEQLAQRSETLLDAGDTGAAQSAYAELRKLLETPVGRSERVEHALAKLHARFAELKGWQHWSNQRRRRALCDEIEALAAAGLHPDAVASRVQEARAEWLRLDATEGHGNAESGLTRHFFAACQRALKPARAYFDKRDAVRDTHRAELEALLTRASAVPEGDSDWKAQTALRRELASALRGVDALNPRDRHQFARRIKGAIEVLTPRIEGHAREVESAKARLIAQAQALSTQAERGAARTARELQQQWTALGEGLRSTDQKQWREFRAACDRVFETLDADRKQREAQSAAQLEQARTLVSEAESVLADASLPADALQARRREFEGRWHECGATERSLDQRFRQITSALADRARQQVRNQHLARYTTALEKSALLQKIECGVLAADDAESQWKSMESATEFGAALDARFERARAGRPDAADADALASARDILVQLEFVAGVASPADDRERRMNYQVSRLSARMRGGGSANPDREVTELFVRWFALPGGLPEELAQRFDSAARAALSTLP